MPRRALTLAALWLAGCRILPTPPPDYGAGRVPISEKPASLTAENLYRWSEGDRSFATFGIRKLVFASSETLGRDMGRMVSFMAWTGSCETVGPDTACRLHHAGTASISMSLALVAAQPVRGTWYDDAGTLQLRGDADGITILDRGRAVAQVALDERPPRGWILRDVSKVDRIRMSPLMVTLGALPPIRPGNGTATSAPALRAVRDRFSVEAAQRARPPIPDFGPDFRSWRPIFFFFEVAGGGMFPVAEPGAAGLSASVSARPALGITTGIDYRDFLQLGVGLEKGVAHDGDRLASISPPGSFESKGAFRWSVLLRGTLFRAGQISTYAGLEYVRLENTQAGLTYLSGNADSRLNTGFSLSAETDGSGWAPQIGAKYKFGPLLRGGDWFSGISADFFVEGRYELISWSPLKVSWRSNNEEGEAVFRAWRETHAEERRSRHLGFRVGAQIRF